MVLFLTGVPGSGKTYKASYTIFNNFSSNEKAKKDLKKGYVNCYTNINGLKFDNLKNVLYLDFEDLYSKLEQLHNFYKKKANDDQLIELCKELNIYKTLFVIDECHNYFDVNDKVLVWWLSYHRHLFHDIFLITQNLSLVYTKYKGFAEYFYKAKPTTLSVLKKNFKYDVFINSRLSMTAKTHTEKLSKMKEVFDIYKSGDSVKAPNLLLKFYIFSFIAFIILIVFGYYYFHHLEKQDNKTVSKTSVKSSIVKSFPLDKSVSVSHIDDDVLTYNDSVYTLLECSLSSCSNDVISLPPKLLSKFVKMNLIHIYYKEKISSSYSKLYLLIKEDFYMKLINNQGVKNDENSNVTIPFMSN